MTNNNNRPAARRGNNEGKQTMITEDKANVRRVEHPRAGRVDEFHKITVSLDEVAARIALWYRFVKHSEARAVAARVEFTPRGKNSPLRTLVITRNDGEELRVSQKDIGPYFQYSNREQTQHWHANAHLEEDCVWFWEEAHASNWWVLANVFSI